MVPTVYILLILVDYKYFKVNILKYVMCQGQEVDRSHLHNYAPCKYGYFNFLCLVCVWMGKWVGGGALKSSGVERSYISLYWCYGGKLLHLIICSGRIHSENATGEAHFVWQFCFFHIQFHSSQNEEMALDSNFILV